MVSAGGCSPQKWPRPMRSEVLGGDHCCATMCSNENVMSLLNCCSHVGGITGKFRSGGHGRAEETREANPLEKQYLGARRQQSKHPEEGLWW
jgi:hypothetical protein